MHVMKTMPVLCRHCVWLSTTVVLVVCIAPVQIDENVPESSKTFTDFQKAMFELCKKVAKKNQDMAIHAGQDTSSLMEDCKEMAAAYCALTDETRGAIGASESSEVSIRRLRCLDLDIIVPKTGFEVCVCVCVCVHACACLCRHFLAHMYAIYMYSCFVRFLHV